jgi:hypothetical protein
VQHFVDGGHGGVLGGVGRADHGMGRRAAWVSNRATAWWTSPASSTKRPASQRGAPTDWADMPRQLSSNAACVTPLA